MKDKIIERIKTLKTERDELVRQVNVELAARGAVIAELEKLIAEPKAEEPEQPTA